MVAACLFRHCAAMASSPFPPGAARPSTPCEVRVRRPFSHVGNLSKTSSLNFCQLSDPSEGASWSVLPNFGHRLISVLGKSLIQKIPPTLLVVIFGPSSLLLTTKNFGSASENLDDLWLEDAGLGSRRHIA